MYAMASTTQTHSEIKELPWQQHSSCGEHQFSPYSLQILFMSLTEVHYLEEETEMHVTRTPDCPAHGAK